MHGSGQESGGGRWRHGWIATVVMAGGLLAGAAGCDDGRDRQSKGDPSGQHREAEPDDEVTGAPKASDQEDDGPSGTAGSEEPTDEPRPEGGGGAGVAEEEQPAGASGDSGGPEAGEPRGRDPGDGGGGAGGTDESLDTTS